MSKHLDAVRLFIASDDFNDEHLNYMDCPECGRTRKLMIALDVHEGTGFAKCLAGTCGIHLPLRMRGQAATEEERAEPRRLRAVYPRTSYGTIPAPVLLDIMKRYYLTVGEVRYEAGWDRKDRRLYWSVRAPDGAVRAAHLRALDDRKQKAITLPYDHFSPLTSWYNVQQGPPLVIVEDIMSAIRASRHGWTALALLGTHVSDEGMAEIAHYGAPERVARVVVALDRDAASRSVKLMKNLRGVLPGQNVSWALLDADLKDLPPAALCAKMESMR